MLSKRQFQILSDILQKTQADETDDPKFRWKGHCPAHPDDRESLSIGESDDGWILLNCHAGCSPESIRLALGVEQKDLGPDLPEKPKQDDNKPQSVIVAEYNYVDENKNLIFQVVRMDPKDFRQRRQENGKWIWSIKGVRRVLYHLPDIINSTKEKEVFIVEGEKDVNNLRKWGILATTCSGGAKAWHLGEEEYRHALKGRKIVIIPDNDEPGQQFAKTITDSIAGFASEIKVVNLPGLPPKGDVSDWIDNGGTPTQLRQIVDSTKPLPKQRHIPIVVVNGRDMRDITAENITILQDANDPPFIFNRSKELVTLAYEDGRPYLRPVRDTTMRNIMSNLANYRHQTENVCRPVFPSIELMRDMMERQLPLPSLDGIVETPIIRPDGTILDQPGYDSCTRLYYCPEKGLDIPPIPENPPSQAIRDAVAIIDDMLFDFPFDSQSSKANAIAMILTPLIRHCIKGTVPLANIDAPKAGSGKTLLSKVVAAVATGKPASIFPAPGDDEEWRKKITSYLIQGTTVIVIDNIEKPLQAPSLAILLTSDSWSDRVLGGSQNITVPNRTTWLATGNNIQLRGDLPRRCYWIRIDPQAEKPWMRDRQYLHEDLIVYICKNRGRILASLLTLARAWFSGGCQPGKSQIIGGFDEWSKTLGGILETAGIDGFLGNLQDSYEQMDEESPQWESFLENWYTVFGDRLISPSDLVDQAKESKIFRESMPDCFHLDQERGLRERVGYMLKKKIDAQFGIYRLERERNQKKRQFFWRVVLTEDAPKDAVKTEIDLFEKEGEYVF